jgi:hypothetical protein
MPETEPGWPATVQSPAGPPRMAAGGLMTRLSGLGRLTHAELREEWRRLFRSQPPKRISRDVLELGVAWKLQERALGGLNRTAARRLSALAASLRATGDIAKPRSATLKPGARLLREWNGETHSILVLEDGFEWRGRRWRSLSVIAREITGTRWSGPRFFGLNTGPADAKPVEAADGQG